MDFLTIISGMSEESLKCSDPREVATDLMLDVALPIQVRESYSELNLVL